MSQITSHVLDTAIGKPAQGILIKLFSVGAAGEKLLGEAYTNADGRVSNLLDPAQKLDKGNYKLSFELDPYFNQLKTTTFYPHADIVFKVAGDGQHYHVPLLLNPFGYSTYRGS